MRLETNAHVICSSKACPSFFSFNTLSSSPPTLSPHHLPPPQLLYPPLASRPPMSPNSSLDPYTVVVATVAVITGNARVIDVKLGSDTGELIFGPSSFSVSSGEKTVFKNNTGFLHNMVFDEDGVPSGVDVAKISITAEDFLNALGEKYAVSRKGV